MRNSENVRRMETWPVQSPETPGFHKVITPDACECKAAQIFRLNLPGGESYRLESGELEMNAVVIYGAASLSGNADLPADMKRFDSFYVPAGTSVEIKAEEDLVMYIGGALYEGIGKTLFRRYDASLPIGEVHQIHGEGRGRREVMFTLTPEDEASRLICGLTWGGDGSWTSWPPHQHEKDLEEVYCYFDIPAPKFGLHLSYLESGGAEDIVAHPVRTGTMVQAPAGYHPTVSTPGVQNAYFWVLAAFTPASRRYDLAVLDPCYAAQ